MMNQKLEQLFWNISIQRLKIQKQNSKKLLESQLTSPQNSWNFPKIFNQNFLEKLTKIFPKFLGKISRVSGRC